LGPAFLAKPVAAISAILQDFAGCKRFADSFK
jgi:hypothetical protein